MMLQNSNPKCNDNVARRTAVAQYEGETFAEIIGRLSTNARSGKPKPWASRVEKIDCRIVARALKDCVDAKIDEHEARLEKAALHSLGRNRKDLDRLMRYRRTKWLKSGEGDGVWFDGFTALLGDLHEQLKGAIVRPSRASRKQQILDLIEFLIRNANAADINCEKIPKTVLHDLVQWAREQA